MDNELILEKIKSLEVELTGNLFKDLELKDQIHKLKMNLEGIRPTDSAFECVGCGS